MIPILGVIYGRMKKLTIEIFIDKAKKIHGNRYDYSKSEYINSRTQITITCPKHGDFFIKPIKHLCGRKCRKCSKEDCSKKQSKGLARFIEDSIKIHGNKYDYSLVEYVNQESRVKIICPSHGVFEQRAKGHVIQKCGCLKCCREKNSGWTTSDWEKRVSPNKVLKIYYIECWNENEHFYKIGLTCKNRVEDRLHGSYKMPYNYKIIKSVAGEVRDLVVLERKFKRQIIDLNDKYSPKMKFSGSTYECFGGKFIPDFGEAK